jgi:hypothetical protein
VWFFLLSCTAKPTLDVNLAAKDLTPPQVVSITPPNGATEVLDKPTIVIAFNEDMDPGTLNSSTVTVKTATGSPGIGSYDYDSAQKALSIKIVQSLYLNTAYTITVTAAVKDLAGNAIVPVTSTFSTDVCPKSRKGKPGFNDTISAIVKVGCTLYVGGEFTSVGEAYAYGVGLDPMTGKADGFTYEDINGPVYAAVSDGNGGWYIGGDFTQIGPYTRNRLAHILANGEISLWNPHANGAVRALAVSGWTVYVGGQFTTIGGATRNHLAAIGSDGSLQSWNPNANSAVYALAVSGSTVYAGGLFTSIGGQTRNYLAAIGSDGSSVTFWDPNANNIVRALAVNDSTVYVGGDFTNIGGAARNRLAAIGSDGSLVTFWDPNANNPVYALAVSGSTVYAGGAFTQIGCNTGCSITGGPFTRNRLAAIHTNGTSLLAWNPNAGALVRALAVSGSTVYAGGQFTSIGGTARNRLAAIDIGGTCLTSYTPGCRLNWNPNASSDVYALAVSGSTVYAGGIFTSIGGQTRNYLAAIGSDGSVQSWNPNANNLVIALAASGSTIYTGGDFNDIGGTGRNRLAAIGTDGSLQSWNPNASGSVLALAVSGSTVYAGGAFTMIGGQTRNRLAAIGTDGSLLAWDPNANSTVRALAVSGSIVYAGGVFTQIGCNTGCSITGGPFTRNYLAAIGTNGSLQSWNPNANNWVIALAASGSTIYTGGSFTCFGNCPLGTEDVDKWTRNRLAAIDISNSCLTAYSPSCLQSWNPNADEGVRALAVSGTTVYAGGIFTSIDIQTRNYLAAVDSDGSLQGWNPNANSWVNTLVVSGSTVYVGGDFTSIGGIPRNRIVSINADGSVNW